MAYKNFREIRLYLPELEHGRTARQQTAEGQTAAADGQTARETDVINIFISVGKYLKRAIPN